MTIRTNPELAAILASANSQYDQVRALDTALTANKRVKAKRVANAATAQADVWATGTLFRDAALVGAFTFSGKDIVGYGKTSGLTKALAADLNTGKSVLRIEGGGHWIEGTLGLAGSGADFIFTANPTATNSIAIAGTLYIRATQSLPVGGPGGVVETGPVTAVGAVLTNIRITNTSDNTITNSPTTFGQVFKAGALPATNAAVELKDAANNIMPCQMDVKATHPDGSVRHAILSAVVPSMAGSGSAAFDIVRKDAPAAGAAPVPSDFAGLAAVVTLTETGTALSGPVTGTTYTADLATLLSAGTYETWISGPVASEWLVRAPLKTAGGAVHPDLHVRFNVRAYAGQSRAKIDFIIENTNLKKASAPVAGSSTWDETVGVSHKVYRVSMSIAGSTVYTRNVKGTLRTTMNNRDGGGNLYGVYPDAPTGLANDSTAYTATFVLNGGAPVNVSIIGASAQTYAQLSTQFNNQFGGAATCTPDPFQQCLLFESSITGPTSSVVCTNYGTLFPALDHINPLRPIYGDEVVHYANTRWKKTFWWGGEPSLHVAMNKEYLMASRAVPNYEAGLTGSQSTIDGWKTQMATAGDIGMAGITNAYMPSTGAAPGIGLLPAWTAMWVVNQGADAKKIMLQMGDLQGGWPLFYRDMQTDKPVSTTTYPMVTISPNAGDSKNNSTGLTEKVPVPVASPYLSINPNVPDVSHHPDFCFGPYLATGDHYYFEGLLFQQRYNTLSFNPVYRQGAKGVVQAEQPRGQAWAMRTLGHSYYLTPDSHPLKAELSYQLAQNLDWYTTNYVQAGGQYHNQLGIIYHGYGMPYTVAGVAGVGFAPWMDGFITSAVGRIVETGNPDWLPFLQFKSKWVVGALTSGADFCWQAFGTYAFRVTNMYQGQLYTTFKEVYEGTFANDTAVLAATCGTQAMSNALSVQDGGRTLLNSMGGYPELPTGFPANSQGAIAYSATYDMPNADNAWLVYEGRTNKPNYNTAPQFGIVPR